jgi:hypothetical protein
MSARQFVFGVAVMLVGASVAPAQHAGDIYIELQGQRIVTGQVAEDGSIELPDRVFPAVFGLDGFDGFTDAPGFDSPQGEFASDERIGFNILAPLCRWTGQGLERVEGETLTMSFIGSARTTDDCIVPGFTLGVSPLGNWHRHFNFVLNPDGGGVRRSGIYFLELELYYTPIEYDPSHPFWIVFNYNAPHKEHLDAIAWAEENLAGTYCPADVVRNNVVDVFDLLEVLGNWGADNCSHADVNHSGMVEVFDLLEVLGAWGRCPMEP